MIKNLIVIIVTCFLTQIALANPTNWQMVPKESSITFIATQNNAPVTGQFNQFEGNIEFDPNDLAHSHIEIIINMNSVSVSYKDVTDTLKMPEWFNVKMFPNATFKANQFVKVNDQMYRAQGFLNLRDKKVPVTLDFTLDEYSATKAQAKGNTVLKRTQFGVGQGEWANTDSIKDDVKVQFVVSAIKK